MVTLLIGKKGTGKTKKLISRANEAVAASNGNVVVIEKGAKLTYDVTHKARLIDTDQYSICGFDMLYGFISGICANLSETCSTNIVLLISADEADVPDSINAVCEKV